MRADRTPFLPVLWFALRTGSEWSGIPSLSRSRWPFGFCRRSACALLRRSEHDDPPCAERRLEPLAVRCAHVEMYVRWLQEDRPFRTLTVSRRLSAVAGFHRTCVIDGLLERSLATTSAAPTSHTKSPALGASHLQFEALLPAARASVRTPNGMIF